MDQIDDDDDDVRFAEKVAAIEAEEPMAGEREPIVTSGIEGMRSHTLYKRVKVDGKWMARVSIRPPVGGDIDDWGNGSVKSSREMLSRLTGLHPAVLRGLDGIDLEILYKMFWDMVPDWLRDTAAGPDMPA